MPELILVRHSIPEIDPQVPASRWHLSEVGRLRAQALAKELRSRRPDILVSSVEPKALETAGIIAGVLGMSHQVADGLHEHMREEAGYMERARFEEKIEELFARPGERGFGSETADQAYERFVTAIGHLLARYPGKSVAVVTHGTVMSLFVSRAAGVDAFGFWKGLGLPGFAALSLPGLALLEMKAV